MKTKPKVFLSGQADEYENNWKEEFKKIEECEFFDWEVDSDQSSADLFFPQDLKGVKEADILIANPGLAPSEGTWMEIGYFYALNTKKPGDFCTKLIIIWRDDRLPKWSLDFIEKAGFMVKNIKEAKEKLKRLIEP